MSKALTHLMLVVLVSAILSAIIFGGVLLIAVLLHGVGSGWSFALNRAPWIAGCVLIAVAFAHGRYVWAKRRRTGQAAGGESRAGAGREE